MLMTFLLVVHGLIAIALVAVILLQRSEGGALGIGGGGSGGLMTARGAANLLTRATAILATLFILTSIGLAVVAKLQKTQTTRVDALLESANGKPAPVVPGAPAPASGAGAPPISLDPLSGVPGVSKPQQTPEQGAKQPEPAVPATE